MLEFFDFFINIWNRMADLLDSVVFNLGGLSVGLFTIFLGFIVIVLVVKVFWKGA